MAEAERFTDQERFAACIADLVRRDPVGATMVSHVLSGHRVQPYPGGPPLMVAVRQGGAVALAALRTGRQAVLVVVDPEPARMDGVFEEFVDVLTADGGEVSGFNGRTTTVLPLAERWTRRTGAACRLRMSTVLYRMAGLVEPVGVPGSVRPAALTDVADLDVLVRWLGDFGGETGVSRGLPAPTASSVLADAERGQVSLLWCVGRVPVALAGHSAVRGGLSRIAPVYTPLEHRRRGFGAAVTAAAVHSARSFGAEEVTLFADADYRPANEVYHRLGFQPIAEFTQLDCLPS
jgi:predicted GNAT family acetyltransferase